MKARHFVLAVHDHFAEKVQRAEIQVTAAASTAHSGSASPAISIVASDAAISDGAINDAFDANIKRAKQVVEDQWALAYINILHVQPLLEAFDDDGTG